jgi:hypothetical protein
MVWREIVRINHTMCSWVWSAGVYECHAYVRD